MAVTDPIADMLTILRNGSFSKKEIVEVRCSKLSEEVLKLFKKEGFINAYKPLKETAQAKLRVYLRYGKDGTPAITGIKRISKPGLRIYKKVEDLPKVYGGLGVAVISTSKGLMADSQARDQKMGGEVLCYIW
jgi:small subunit ribosomal protein S8